ncbi:hypothetical protein HYT23_01685 [Candidatus Pacearchaeota archaeon]|nr:hypothetical protein [Candidatus Pacearchaeota archaeon]
MTKKSSPKHHVVHHKTHIAHHASHPHSLETIPLNTSQMLLENFVSLQRVLTNLSLKLEEVSIKMTKLLDLFEVSAKALAEKDFDVEKDNKEILSKLETLQDQNKTLARGISLLHERVPREAMMPALPPAQPVMQVQSQMQPSMQQMPTQTQMISPRRQEFMEIPRPQQRKELPEIPRKQSPIQPKTIEAQPEEEEFIEETEDFDVPRFDSPTD